MSFFAVLNIVIENQIFRAKFLTIHLSVTRNILINGREMLVIERESMALETIKKDLFF